MPPDRAYHKLALKDLAAKKTAAAIKTLRAGLKIDKKFARGHYDLAGAYVPKQPRNAVATLRKAVRLDASLIDEARDDAAFASLRDHDVELIELIDPDHLLARSARALREGSAGEVVAVLALFGDTIPYRLIGFGFHTDPELLPVDEAFKRDLPLAPAALEAIATRALAADEETDGTEARHLFWLIYARQSGALLGRLNAQLLARYIARADGDELDHDFLRSLLDREPGEGAAALLKAMVAHPDRFLAYADQIATMMDRAPTKQRDALVAFVDQQLTGAAKPKPGESADARHKRIMLSLPAPKMRLNYDDKDHWAGERIAVAHPHPGVAIPMAQHLLLQDKKLKLRPVVHAQRHALLAHALDEEVDAELREAAVAVLQELGDKPTLAALKRGRTSP